MMKSVPLGNTGESVSTLCLGAMYFGTRQNRKESFNLLDQYFESGGTFIDTANIYAHWIDGFKGGESEAVLGQWLKERNNRDQVFIASKVGFGYQDVPSTLQAEMIEKECEKSLRRLGVDKIDLYYAHRDDRDTPLEETLEAFLRLVDSGKVRFIGASNYLAWRLEEAHWLSITNEWPEFCCVQQRHTYIRRKHGTTFNPQVAANEDLLDYVSNRGITLLAYSALLSGAYTRSDRDFSDQYLSSDTDNRLSALNEVAAETGATANQVILAWMMQSIPAVVPLIAASSSEQLKENIDALNLFLTADQLEKLDSAGP
ncbi:MAG: aldo/keto reductase [Anaerolineales bacterium]|jgi:aryl-alcohol dehydrogenase-like predicted oxidoreductase